jgi:hypothetical protein
MIIYSGYFGGLKKYNYPNPINIALKAPDYWTGPNAKWLAPSPQWFWLWKKSLDTKTNKEAIEEYSELYFQTILRNLMPLDIINRLSKLSNEEDCTLICFEKPPLKKIINPDSLEVNKDFCHRHIITSFLRNCGYDAFELI